MANDEVGFPESHKQFLGGISYRAMFGFDPGAIAQGYISSDMVLGDHLELDPIFK